MIRTAAYSIAATITNLFLVAEIQTPDYSMLNVTVMLVISIAITIMLVRHAMRRGTNRAMRAIIEGGDALDLILREAESRGLRGTRKSNRE